MRAGRKDPKFWQDWVNRLGAYQELIKRFLSKASAKQAKLHNKERREAQFKVEDLVMLADHPLSNAGKYFSVKLAKPYSGPYKIIERISNTVFKRDLSSPFLKPFLKPLQI